MKVFLLLLVCMIATVISQFIDDDYDVLGVSSEEIEFADFEKKHNKSYNTPGEQTLRFNTYLDTKNKVSKHNDRFAQGLVDFKVGLNKYSDWLHTEFVKKMNGYLGGGTPKSILNVFVSKNRNDTGLRTSLSALPASVDWRTSGRVTSVKDQSGCACCWSFAAAGALEAYTAMKTNSLFDISNQNLIDCTYGGVYLNLGCNGGWPYRAFNYVKNNNGIEADSTYWYTEQYSGECLYEAVNRRATCTGFVRLAKSEAALAVAVATIGPVTINVDSSLESFKNYNSGIYYDTSCSSTYTDHSMLVVGYGTASGKDYWLIKNSWGTTWGENGYMRLRRNSNNHCGIVNEAVYPI